MDDRALFPTSLRCVLGSDISPMQCHITVYDDATFKPKATLLMKRIFKNPEAASVTTQGVEAWGWNVQPEEEGKPHAQPSRSVPRMSTWTRTIRRSQGFQKKHKLTPTQANSSRK